jgi:hypothetical protein
MSNLSDISIDQIEIKLMAILYNNRDINYSQYTLYNKLIVDKFCLKNTSIVDPSFKARYFLVIRNLISKYDDIIITKDNNIYYIMCKSDKENINVVKHEEKIDINIYNDLIIRDNYIVDNNMNEEFDYVDPLDGNTIYHDLVITKNKDTIKKLISLNKFNFRVKNKLNLSPLDLSTDTEITNILINAVINKLMKDIDEQKIDLENKQKIIEEKDKQINYLKSEEYNKKILCDTSFTYFLFLKLGNFVSNNKKLSLSLLVIMIAYIFTKFSK